MGHYDEQREEHEARREAEHFARHGMSISESEELRRLQREVREYESIEYKKSRLAELQSKDKWGH